MDRNEIRCKHMDRIQLSSVQKPVVGSAFFGSVKDMGYHDQIEPLFALRFLMDVTMEYIIILDVTP